MNLASNLESGRREFLKAIDGISSEQLAARPQTGGWSVLECVEHVVIVEARYMNWLVNGTETSPEKDTEKEVRLFTVVRNRDTRIEAPEAARPKGRFENLSSAVDAFNAARDLTIEFVRERGDGLYSIGAKHPFFGLVNGAELVRLLDGHTSRHAGQIREILETLA